LKKIYLTLLIITFLLACKKENDRPQWEVNVIGPLAHATLGVNNFIADSITQSDSTHAINLVYEDQIYTTNLDSLFQIPDTSFPNVFVFPLSTYALGASTPIYSNTNNISLNESGVELREVIVKSGYFHVEANNRLQTNVIYTYTIPKATLNGIPFQFTVNMNPAPAGGSVSYSGLFDLSGYKFDLTGMNGNEVNTLSYDIAAQTAANAPNDTVYNGDTLVNIQAGFRDIIPYYAKGYLGQKEIQQGLTSDYFSPFAAIKSGNIRLKDVSMKLIIENNVGVDAQAIVNQLRSVNTRTHAVVDLTAPQLISHTININRAAENGNTYYPVNPTYYTVNLDHTNSNLVPFIENLPDRIDYALNLNVNPLGNISGSNDFVYSDYLVNMKLRIDMPLAFAADHITLADTTELDIPNKEDFDPVGPGTFTLIADNGFPFDADLHVTLLDEHDQFVDSIPVSGYIAAAPVDVNFKVISPKRTKIPVYVDQARKQRILGAKEISLRVSFTTPGYPQAIQIYTDYKLNVKLVADASYLIH